MGSRYAIYFIPTSDNEFYQAGSRVLGYDIRLQEVRSTNSEDNPPLLLHFGSAHYFGFHATIRGTFKTYGLPELENKLSLLARNTSPITIDNSYIHSLSHKDRVVLFNSSPESKHCLFQFHAQVVRLVNEYRVKDYIAPETEAIIHTLGYREIQLLKAHGDTRVMDGHIFHFTLANRASAEELALVDKYIKAEERNLCGVQIYVDRICLVEQQGENPYWKISKEYIFGEHPVLVAQSE